MPLHLPPVPPDPVPASALARLNSSAPCPTDPDCDPDRLLREASIASMFSGKCQQWENPGTKGEIRAYMKHISSVIAGPSLVGPVLPVVLCTQVVLITCEGEIFKGGSNNS